MRIESVIIRCLIKNLCVLTTASIICIFPCFSQISESNADQTSTKDETEFREKIFLHLDRKLYLSGEIIWFKGYCTNREFNIPSDVSKVMYVEVLNNQNQPILREKIFLERGKCLGTINIPRSIQTGIYYIRAYTRWMTNFPPEYYFADRIFIVNPFIPVETVKIIPDESEDYVIHYFTRNKVLEIGRKCEIAFLAQNQSGDGADLKGWVVNESGDTLATLNTWKFGYGFFSFIPQGTDRDFKIITISSNGRRKESLLQFPGNDRSRISMPRKENIDNDGFEINVHSAKTQFSPREKVTLTIETKNSVGNAIPSDLSVSVYKSGSHPGFYHKNIFQYLNYTSLLPVPALLPDDKFPFSEYDSDTLKNILDIIYSFYSIQDTVYTVSDTISDKTYTLPEIRGLTVNGTVYGTEDGKPSPGVKLYIAQPGKSARIYATRSVFNGRFQIQLYNQYGRNDIIVMPAENPEDYYIVLDEDFNDNFSRIEPESFYPDESTIGYIEELMVNMQIADAFGNYQAKPSRGKEYELPAIYGEPDESILLEDYIKLPAVEELFTELVKSVLIKRRKNNFELQIIDPSARLPISGKPLLLLDGVPVLDINPVIIYMDPVDIEKIEVVRYRYIQGSEMYQGIINLITKQADFHHFDLPSYGIRKPYLFFQSPLEFHSPDHSSDPDSLRSIPDFRNLLYWNPEVVTNDKGIATISFYTCDDISDYKIVVQGLNEYGLPGYAEGAISVK